MALKRTKPRSPQSQLGRMAMRWPALDPCLVGAGDVLAWIGPLRGLQMSYQVQVQWEWTRSRSFPCVFVLDPPLRPRPGGPFVDIPHLIYNGDAPAHSALCLFDPDEGEWNVTMWISDTTIPWASEWLHHYELWHVDGVWRGANAPGPISVGAAQDEVLHDVQ